MTTGNPKKNIQKSLRIAEIKKSGGAKVRISLDLYKRLRTINVRTWNRNAKGKSYPTQKGISLGIKRLPELADGIKEALRQARNHRFLPSKKMRRR